MRPIDSNQFARDRESLARKAEGLVEEADEHLDRAVVVHGAEDVVEVHRADAADAIGDPARREPFLIIGAACFSRSSPGSIKNSTQTLFNLLELYTKKR